MVTTPFFVAPFTTGAVAIGDMIRLADGRVAFVHAAVNTATTTASFFATMLGQDGNVLSHTEFLTIPSGGITSVSVKADPFGGFAISYLNVNGTDPINDQTTHELWRIDANLQIASDRLLQTFPMSGNASVGGPATTPSADMTVLANGNTATITKVPVGEYQVTIYNPLGALITEFKFEAVSASLAGVQRPSIAETSDGNLLVTYAILDPVGTGSNPIADVYAAVYSPTGTRLHESGPFASGGAASTGTQQSLDELIELSDGNFMITYNDQNAGFDRIGVIVDKDLNEIQTLTIGDAGSVKIVALDGKFAVITRESNAFGTSHVLQMYDNDGTLRVGEVEEVSGGPFLPSLYQLDDGGVLAVAVTEFGTGFDGRIFLQTSGRDDFFAMSESGILRGGAGDDTLFGSDGDDAIFGNTGADVIFGDSGNDIIKLGSDLGLFEAAHGGDGNDLVRDGAGQSSLTGGEGHDVLISADLADTLEGGNGNDRLRANGGDDFADGGAGADRIWGHAGEDTLLGDKGKDTIYGGDDADDIDGGAGNDRLMGEAGDDFVAGDTGGDTINGGLGDDILSGGTGTDTFVFDVANFGDDVIIDWEDGDVIRFENGIAATANVEKDGDRVFISVAGGTIDVLSAEFFDESTDILFV